jgi:hypothetical protein
VCVCDHVCALVCVGQLYDQFFSPPDAEDDPASPRAATRSPLNERGKSGLITGLLFGPRR